jgi:hypothetical protein
MPQLNKVNLPFRILFSALLGLAIAFAFDSLFLKLTGRPQLDQISLVAVSTAAVGYLVFSLWQTAIESGGLRISFPKMKFDASSISSTLRKNAPGLVLALAFFGVYVFFGLQINFADSDTTDNFFEADNYPWMNRIAYPTGYQYDMRAPHPFAYFIFRPLGALFNLFTSNPWLSAILLNALTGGLCVFLAWLFIKRQFQSPAYALLIASLLGLSTSHFFFGAVIETYIFSAAAMIGFFLVLQKDSPSLFAPVGVSVLTFGITLTNFVQNFIGFFVTQGLKIFSPKREPGETKKAILDFLARVFRFTALTLSIGIAIGLIHAAWYSTSRLFYVPTDAAIENDYSLPTFQGPMWRVTGRMVLLVRTILLYAVVAPKPFVFGKEMGATIPYFNFFKLTPEIYSYSSYNGLGKVLLVVWVALLLASGLFFLWKLFRTRTTDLSLVCIISILFNFVLHLSYGFESFLYSPDWAYALIFFVGLSLGPLAKNRIFQAGMLVFLVLLAYNQVQFFQFVLATIAPFYGRGG